MIETGTIGADAIAERLGLNRPTPEQRAVIEAPLEPALVVAGAGSGKTETMAFRVLWLLANGLVAAPQVLGLTFTRKAAGELQHRIRSRIKALHAAGLAPSYDEFDPPEVSTYNAFANGIYRDWASLIGREGNGVVLGEASAWQLARAVVVESTDPALGDLDVGVDWITQLVLSLAGDLGEHAADAVAVRAMAAEYAGALEQLPMGGRGTYADCLATALKPARTLPVLLDLVARFDERKRALGAVQYADQVSLALEILRRSPRVAVDYRDRYRVVLLDEYQDTSVVQTRLLAQLFRGSPVMAVGDPHQSIYGWRGASAANLEGFAADFAVSEGRQAFSLSTSWRNGTGILAIANRIAAPLTASSAVAVGELLPSPFASDLPVDAEYAETLEEEADRVAAWFAEHLDGPHEAPPSAAMLLRARSNMPAFLAAFRRRGVPYHVLGVGGLLQEPEVADLVCALRVVHDGSAGAELVRLLAGGTWRVGPADLLALHNLARWLEQRDWKQQRLEAPVLDAFGRSVAEGESASIVEALDFLGRTGVHGSLRGFTEAGLARLREAGRLFARLRERSGGGDLPGFVHTVVEALQLDVEVLANPARDGLGPLQAFDEALAGYLAVAEGGTLGGFLGWLTVAERKEDLRPRSDPPEAGTVQVLTVHGSKGLEWDLVAVPRLVADELPAKPQETTGWLRAGVLPWQFRGDAAQLPVFGWRSAADRKALQDELGRFKAEVRERHLKEERRLAYVAVTRARHRLLLSGSFWATQTSSRAPSMLLTELAEDGLIPPLPEGPRSETKPADADPGRFTWPRDPLGGRRPVLEAAAQAVRHADAAAATRWSVEIDALLAERAELLAGRGSVVVPPRVPASRFKDYVDDAAAVAAGLRRPMPERPYRQTRLGTLFHAWVEERSKRTGATELLDAFLGERDEELDLPVAGLEELQAKFAASPWGSLEPLEVETEIQLPFAGHIVVCKLDAVYEREGRIEIVDWKTGMPPKDAADLELKQYQLALYRLAYAKREGIDPESVDALFYYVAADQVVRPERIYSERELRERWSGVVSGAVLA